MKTCKSYYELQGNKLSLKFCLILSFVIRSDRMYTNAMEFLHFFSNQHSTSEHSIWQQKLQNNQFTVTKAAQILIYYRKIVSEFSISI